MSLIATNKISEYIDLHPEARIPLLSWLKEYPYELDKTMFSRQDQRIHPGCTVGEFGVGQGDYVIKCRINYTAKIVCITWVGNKEANKVEMNRELKKVLQKNPDALVKAVSVTMMVQAPVPQITEDVFSVEAKDKPIDLNSEFELAEGEGFLTVEEYEQGLDRAALIFEAEPNTPEFDELLALVPLIKRFENDKLKFPTLSNFEAVKRKMEILDMIPLHLARFAGSEDHINLFLSGKLALSDEIVNRLFKFLFVRFPINDRRFIS